MAAYRRGWLKSHQWADWLYTGISSGPNVTSRPIGELYFLPLASRQLMLTTMIGLVVITTSTLPVPAPYPGWIYYIYYYFIFIFRLFCVNLIMFYYTEFSALDPYTYHHREQAQYEAGKAYFTRETSIACRRSSTCSLTRLSCVTLCAMIGS